MTQMSQQPVQQNLFARFFVTDFEAQQAGSKNWATSGVIGSVLRNARNSNDDEW